MASRADDDSGSEGLSFARQRIPEQSFQSSLSLSRAGFLGTEPRAAEERTGPPHGEDQDQGQDQDATAGQVTDDGDEDDGDDAASQARSDTLAVDALKKLSLRHHPVDATDAVEQDNIDFSTFASLTRQPRMDSRSVSDRNNSLSVLSNLESVSSEMAPADNSGGSDGLALRPMRAEETNPMQQYESRRRPVSPSPLLKGEFLDLPVSMAQSQSEPVRQNAAAPAPARPQVQADFGAADPRQHRDNAGSDTNLVRVAQAHAASTQKFRPAALNSPAAPLQRASLSQPVSATQPEFTIAPPPHGHYSHHHHHHAAGMNAFHSHPVLPTIGTVVQDELPTKDPQGINRLKRPLYVPAVLRPTLANSYSDMASSQSSLGSEMHPEQYSRDLLRYKEYNNLSFVGGGSGAKPAGIASVAVSPAMSQQSSLSSSPGAQVQAAGSKLSKIVEKLMAPKPAVPAAPDRQQQLQHLLQAQQQQQSQTSQQSDASSVLSNSSSVAEPGPSRDHWKLDTIALRCSSCSKIFTNFGQVRRKHHCRACGEIFCTNCISHYIYLDRDARFVVIDAFAGGSGGSGVGSGAAVAPGTDDSKDSPAPSVPSVPGGKAAKCDEKYLVKCCYQCFENYENALRQKNPAIFNIQVPAGSTRHASGGAGGGDDDGDAEDEDDDDGRGAAADVRGVRDGDGTVGRGPGGPRQGSVAALPADWDWSSF